VESNIGAATAAVGAAILADGVRHGRGEWRAIREICELVWRETLNPITGEKY
jgi:hypothetical protein